MSDKPHHRTQVSIFEGVVVFFLLFFYLALLVQPINMQTADLGRHLKNGQIFFQDWQIPQTNLYSYTYPDRPFINHHWGTGVIFYAVYTLGDFPGLSLFFIALSLLTFFIFWKIAKLLGADFRLTALIALVVIPILASRVEIRPEVFSYLFLGIFLWMLLSWQKNRLATKWLMLLPVLELLWVNIHIYFFLGGVAVLALILENIYDFYIRKNNLAKDKLRPSVERGSTESSRTNVKKLIAVLAGLGLAVLLNPSGYHGALYPLFIMKDFGYRLFENQSFWFIENLFSYPPALYFKILLAVFIAGWVWRIISAISKKSSFSPAVFLLSVFFVYLALTAVRNFAVFGYLALAVAPANLSFPAGTHTGRRSNFLAAILLIITLSLILVINPGFWRTRPGFGLGLIENTDKSMEFFKKENLRGPILNNYDNGGYLIFHLYPQEKVFVDNRPEAYPLSFFQDTYIPLQEDNNKFLEVDQKYNFNVIYFWRHDLTPWGQKFLVSRIDDTAWAPVYLDDFAIIFLKRNKQNATVIDTYEIPRNQFQPQ